jgi:hypothetical protein
MNDDREYRSGSCCVSVHAVEKENGGEEMKNRSILMGR